MEPEAELKLIKDLAKERETSDKRYAEKRVQLIVYGACSSAGVALIAWAIKVFILKI